MTEEDKAVRPSQEVIKKIEESQSAVGSVGSQALEGLSSSFKELIKDMPQEEKTKMAWALFGGALVAAGIFLAKKG